MASSHACDEVVTALPSISGMHTECCGLAHCLCLAHASVEFAATCKGRVSDPSGTQMQISSPSS